jgi:predicted dehydrogenase
MNSPPNLNKPIKIAIAGAGQIGKRHLDMVLQNAANKYCAVHSVIDPSPAAADLAARLNVPCYRELGELLALQNAPDGVVLATPNALHVPQALQCVARGIPVLVEKPIATTVADAQMLCDAAQISGDARHIFALQSRKRRLF